MTRFLCFTLLFLISLPASAQDTSPTLGQALPRDPAFLMRMRDQLTLDLRETQRMLGFINPSDTQLVETLQTRQADLAKQLSNLAQELQTLGTPNMGIIPGMDVRPGMSPMQPGLMPTQPIQPPRQEQGWQQAEIGHGMMGGMPVPGGIHNYSSMPVMPVPGVPSMTYPPTPMYNGMPSPQVVVPNVPQLGSQAQGWDEAHWGPRLPKELTEVRQSVESLRREITELRETVKSLETQIQLLNRTILLSERVNERVPVTSAPRENEE